MKFFIRKWLLPIIVLCILLLIFNFSDKFNIKKNDDMNALKVGDMVPEFTLPDQNGVLFDIKSNPGNKKLVIYFYPKDDSPGCTKEACYFRDLFEAFREADALIIGISAQSVASHKKFAEKHRLSFTLLSDKGNIVRKLFGVPTNALGLLPGRVTYVADRKGRVVYIFNSQSQAERHVDEALKILKSIE
jgi:thioredoxin-dependent peroxiredoxin